MAKAAANRAKAKMHLIEAQQIVAQGIAPAAAVHSAYFAMELAAAATLLINGGADKFGDVPKSHAHIIEHFAKLISETAPELTGLLEGIQKAQIDRIQGDYELTAIISKEQAIEVTDSAAAFLTQCEVRWPIRR